MRNFWSLAAIAALLAVGTTVWSYPNLNATTGILAVPTADVATTRVISGAADVLFFDDTTVNVRALTNIATNTEAGATVIFGTETEFGATIKYRFPSTLASFNWAVGASAVFGDSSGVQVFVTGTRAFGATGSTKAGPLLGTIGVNFTDIESASAFRPFVGAQLPLSSALELDGEFVLESGDFGDSITTLMLRYRLDPRWTVQLGTTNAAGFTATSDHNFFIGAATTL